ncbi:MAG: YjgN family protein [Geminicoccaceae bacterium]
MAFALNKTLAPDLVAPDEKHSGLPFAFTGKAGEYFGIWIVNLLLSVVTLGIYSAWAKVRTKRYFYGNTKLDGSTFDYLASPVQILKGRLITFAFFFAYALCSSFVPALIWIFILAMVVITPWVVVRALSFNAYNSSYRNVQFGFIGRTAEAAKLYVLMPVLSFLTIGALWPYTVYLTRKFFVTNSRYGQTEFTFDGKVGAFYKYYAITLAISLVAIAIYGAAFITGVGETKLDPENIDLSIFLEFSPIKYFWIGTAFILAIVSYGYLAVKLQSYFLNNTKIGGHQLKLELKLSRFIWIRLSNLVVIVFSFGLMIPWAKIRMTRYQVEQMSLFPCGDLEALVSDQQKQDEAYGSELGEGMDLDLGLGV